ncbi:HNH endonuclease [Nocardia sp. NPDC058518]|uniref:HNH endonuclease n=1 Tax=Nocardia sp. NPDC058518 TaxID=3346534 RepID=UPI0036501618
MERYLAGWCSSHYQRWRHHGDPLGGNPSPKILKAVDHPDGTRTCSECNVRQPLTAFNRDPNATLGHRSKCKNCHGNKVSEWYYRDHEARLSRIRACRSERTDELRKQDIERYVRDRDKRLELAVRASHVRRARLADNEYEDGISRKALRKRDGDNCCYCGRLMDFARYPRGTARPDNLATIEHVVPISAGGPHTFANCALACWRCNSSKGARQGLPNKLRAPSPQLVRSGTQRSRCQPTNPTMEFAGQHRYPVPLHHLSTTANVERGKLKIRTVRVRVPVGALLRRR